MPLERLQIENFEKHVFYRIKFSERITTIVGPSKAGKSTIIRALRWLATNRPNDAGITTHGADDTKASLWVDGRKIVRSRGKGGQLYALDDKEFKAFGTEVPAAILTLLNIDEINWQAQLDQPYWFGMTPGQTSKALNAIVDLEIMDETLSKLSGMVRKAGLAVEISRDRFRAAKQQREDTANAVKMGKDLEIIEALQIEVTEKRSKSTRIARIVEDVQSLTLTRDRATDAIQSSRSVQIEIKTQLDQLEMHRDRRNAILESLDKIGYLKQCQSESKAELESLQKELAKIKLCQTCGRPM